MSTDREMILQFEPYVWDRFKKGLLLLLIPEADHMTAFFHVAFPRDVRYIPGVTVFPDEMLYTLDKEAFVFIKDERTKIECRYYFVGQKCYVTNLFIP